ncbi:N-acetyl-gamma-glutamyl-phosphate reductase [Prochlorococcus sp. MIT 1223]|uniref:N-acetyl-gamma-glutamyl-phosphate reductase n=1 Tax=Prochlorococcus sp. MIT 1223 TaxID=3096217 RepID=UPI002A75BAFC|nr:N-acetyl-gamma-glutamyl-phosphate reductase [Prochlorococcus sp. MIT 1223]
MEFAKTEKKRVAILGATGYGGIQLVRLLSEHPSFEITFLGGDRNAGRSWNELFPYINLKNNLEIENINIERIVKKSDYVLLSLPNGLASSIVPDLISQGLRVLDLSADYRYTSLDDWKSAYSSESIKYEREDYDLCHKAIYGLPELNRKEIAKSNLVACPGCFPTASLLGLFPFLKQGLIDYEGIIIDAKTGTSGGGRIPKEHLLFSECSESISPYGVIGHRHTSEIENIAGSITGHPIELQFTPHLVPMVRGILSTIYARLRDPGLRAEDCATLLDTFYRKEPFVEILPVGIYPSTKWVKQTNKVLISVQVDKRSGRLVIMSVIDNLIKGQAGQAIQNLNIMANLEEYISLPVTSFQP